jgi:hypothetical protein
MIQFPYLNMHACCVEIVGICHRYHCGYFREHVSFYLRLHFGELSVGIVIAIIVAISESV